MSRPRGSGFAASKSIKASAASIGRDFLYPTAFMVVLPDCKRVFVLPVPQLQAAVGRRSAMYVGLRTYTHSYTLDEPTGLVNGSVRPQGGLHFDASRQMLPNLAVVDGVAQQPKWVLFGQ